MADSFKDRLATLALDSLHTSDLVSQASERSLFAKSAAIQACVANAYQPSVVWHPTVFDCFMQLDLRERVSQEIFLTGAFEPDLLWFFSGIIEPGMNVFDCGAHIGFFTLAFGNLVGPSGHVDAFEPVDSTKIHLDTNVRNSGLVNIKTHALAVWSRAESLVINDWGHALSAFNGAFAPRLSHDIKVPEPRRLEAQAVTLDSFSKDVGRSPDLIKIDVESAEDHVLRGLEQLLKVKRPIIAMEIGDFDIADDAPDSVDKYISTKVTLKRLLDENYKLYELSERALKLHTLKETEPYTYGNIVALPAESAEATVAKMAAWQSRARSN